MDNPIEGRFPVHLVAFEGESDEGIGGQKLAEITDAGNGFAEFAVDHEGHRLYVAFRTADLLRAIKEAVR